MKNIKWCLDTLDEMNSESNSSFKALIYDRLVAAYKDLEEISNLALRVNEELCDVNMSASKREIIGNLLVEIIWQTK
jgi:hypothetical protein